MKKEDIRAIIYREILEYHPQLLKDYMAQKESTNVLYPRSELLYMSICLHVIAYMATCDSLFISFCVKAFVTNIMYWSYPISNDCISAVGQFKKQFAYLADNGGKSGPVTDRKHASVPRYGFGSISHFILMFSRLLFLSLHTFFYDVRLNTRHCDQYLHDIRNFILFFWHHNYRQGFFLAELEKLLS